MSQPSTNKVTLLGFQLKGQSLVGIGTISAVDLRPDQDTPSPGVFLGWSLHLRGPMAYLVSPETSTSMVRVNDAAIKASQALTNEQLNAQLRAEFVRAAWSFTPEEWATLDEVRAKRAREPEASS